MSNSMGVFVISGVWSASCQNHNGIFWVARHMVSLFSLPSIKLFLTKISGKKNLQPFNPVYLETVSCYTRTWNKYVSLPISGFLYFDCSLDHWQLGRHTGFERPFLVSIFASYFQAAILTWTQLPPVIAWTVRATPVQASYLPPWQWSDQYIGPQREKRCTNSLGYYQCSLDLNSLFIRLSIKVNCGLGAISSKRALWNFGA